MINAIQVTAYLVAALFSGFFALRGLSLTMWGVQVNPIARIALLGSIGLLFAAITSTFKPDAGRKLAIASLVAMSTFWVPAVRELGPLRNTLFDLRYFFALSVQFLPFFAAAFLALLYPTRTKAGVSAAACLALAALAVFAATTRTRAMAGEYRTPQLIFYKWIPSPAALTVQNGFRPLDKEISDMLTRNGIGGKISWNGSSGKENTRKLIFLVAGQIPTSYEAHFPREGAIVNAYDGKNWRTLPADATTFKLAASLEPSGKSTQCWLQEEYGREGCASLAW
jgi:hypothetical protein